MKKSYKILSLVMVLLMAMALCSSAFAAGTSNLTISTVNGHTYKVYQMLIGDVSGLTPDADDYNAVSGVIANVDEGANLKSDTTAEDFIAAVEGLSGDELAKAADSYKTGDPTNVIGTGSDVTTEVANGYYLIEDTWTSADGHGNDAISRYMVDVVGATTVTPKTDVPEIDKNIIDTDANAALEGADATSKKTDTAAIGDVIDYEVTGEVPDMTGYTYYYYYLTDTMSDGLTLVDTYGTSDGTNGFIVTVGDETLTRGEDYYVYKNGQTFKLAFENMKDYTAGDEISIKYSATVNDNAVISSDANTNTVNLTYSNNPNISERHDETGTPDNPSTPDTPDYPVTPDNPDGPNNPENPNNPDNPGEPGIPDNPNTPDNPDTPEDEGKTYHPTGVTPERVTKTYVTELTIVKVDENEAILNGAKFELSGTNLTKVELTTATEYVAHSGDGEGEFYQLANSDGTGNGKYTKEAPKADKSNIGDYVTTGEDDAKTAVTYDVKTSVSATSTEATGDKIEVELINGAFTIKGLNAGEYTLKETKTPTGYNTIDDIKFTLSAAQDGTTTATEGTAVKWSSNNTAVQVDSTYSVFNATIKNVKGNTLPSTGGMGTTIFYIVGAVLIVGAGIALITKKRMSGYED